MVGTGLGVRRGILFKQADSLEQAATLRTVVFDKTGTLTRGEPEVTAVATADGITEDELLRQRRATPSIPRAGHRQGCREARHPLAAGPGFRGRARLRRHRHRRGQAAAHRQRAAAGRAQVPEASMPVKRWLTATNEGRYTQADETAKALSLI